MKSAVLVLSVLIVLSSVVLAEPLPNTQPLTIEGDLARKMVDGIHAYLDRELTTAPAKRDSRPKSDLATKRERLRKMLGVVDERIPPRLESFAPFLGDGRLTPNAAGSVHRVRWDVLPNVVAEGLFVEGQPRTTAIAIAIPHAGQTPEGLLGLGNGKPEDFYVKSLTERGVGVYIPAVLDRSDTHSGNARMNRFTNYSHREWIHRMAYEMGRTVPGYEVQQVLALVDHLAIRLTQSKLPLGVIGYGDGGRVALFAAALDDRITHCQISGAFGPQENLWQMPIDRNVWGILTEFGDAELASMIAPRKLVIDPCRGPMWGSPSARPGRSGMAPGELKPFTLAMVQAEYLRIPAASRESVKLIDNAESKVDRAALCDAMNAPPIPKQGIGEDVRVVMSIVTNAADKPEVEQKRLLDRQANFSQNLWRHSEPVRKEFWKKADASSLEKWEQSCEWYRNYFHEEAIGKLPEPTKPLNTRSREIYNTPKWVGHEVVLDVYDDVIAYGIVLFPRDLKPGERRPVVVCQHGLEGRPMDVCDPTKRTKYYNSFGAQLADRGYIVFAPQNPYIFDTHFRQIMRKANPLKLSLFSFIIRQHQRILDWLETQPNVDAKRIAFYGLSYGGKTAMRVPAVEKRYCLSICSGDFNEWIGKIVSTELPMGYMFTKEYDMLEFNLGHTFNYAEMANLIAPRPFMVERGHDDGVGIDEMIAYEYAKVRYLYANRLKIPDRTEIEFFVGGHEINGKGTFAFLDRHLNR